LPGIGGTGQRTLHPWRGQWEARAALVEKKRLQSAKNWKVIVVLDRQGLGLQSVTANSSEAIALMMPNSGSLKGKEWKSFRVSVKQAERERRLKFLSNVPSQVQQVIESKVDSQ